MPAHTPHRAPRARTVAVALLAPLALACPAPGTTVGEMSRPRPDDAAPSPPETLSFEWTTADQARATDQRSHPFALFPDDRSEDDLARCREARIWEAPFDPQQVRCAYRPTASLRVGASTWWLGAYAEHSEWDGMTSLTEDVILAVPGDPTGVRHTVRQYEESIVDCRTTIVQRRQTVRDLDGDGRDELCIEEVRESGPGLFAFLALADRGEPWIPFVRRRRLTAWTADDDAGRLLRAEALDASCPAEGYGPFVPPASIYSGGPLVGRRELQGERPVAPCSAEAAEAEGCGEGYCDDPESP
jgi:hypothetical protein